MKLVGFIVTAFIQLVAAAFGFFILLLGLNGFSEKQSTPSLIFYIVLGLLSSLGVGTASAYTAEWIVEKFSLGKVGASMVAIAVFAILGALILIVGLIAAIFLAETLRTWK